MIAASPFAIAGATHAGHRRPNNEDRFVVDLVSGLAVVADGMGGELGGEVAAEQACLAVRDLTRTTAPDEPVLAAAMTAAADHVTAQQRQLGHDGMGSTIAAVRIRASEGVVEIAHVGDVRVYLLRRSPSPAVPSAAPAFCPPTVLPSGAAMVCVTRDHSSLCELVERGHVSRDAAARHPLRSRISRALGRDDTRADLSVLPLVAGDRLLVCSDGLWSAVTDASIAEIVERATPEAACDALVAAALAAGGDDNITAVVVHWRGIQAPLAHDLDAIAAGLRARVIGQSEAIDAAVDALRRGQASRRDRSRPHASLVLAGETGVGKTTMARALADLTLGGEGLVELAELGAGDVAVRVPEHIAEALRRRPASTIVFDALDRAHPDIQRLFGHIVDTGMLGDVSLREALVIATMTQAPGHDLATRVDGVVSLRGLGPVDLLAIVDIAVRRLEDRLREQGIAPPAGPMTRSRVLARIDADPRARHHIERIAEDTIATLLDAPGGRR